jgi:5-methyltetrahydrofolate--homocysteine methyltransferase
MKPFLDLLREKIIVFDGAMGVSLQALNLSIDDWGGPQFENCSENLLYTRPDVVEKVHTSFLDMAAMSSRRTALAVARSC